MNLRTRVQRIQFLIRSRNEDEKRTTALLLLISVFGFLFRMWHLSRQGFWFDETYTRIISVLPRSIAWDAIVSDGVHPPLYYLLMRLFHLLGDSELVLRFPSVLFGTLTIPATFILGKRWGGRTVGVIGALLMALSPFGIWYSREARMYALLMLLCLLIVIEFDQFLRNPSFGHCVSLTLITSLAFLTQYFALLIPLIQFVFIVIRFRKYAFILKRWVLVQFVSALPLGLWIYVLWQRPVWTFGIGWIPASLPVDLVYTYINFIVGYVEPLTYFHWAAFFICGALGIFGLTRRWSFKDAPLFLGIWTFLPVALIFLLSLKRHVYVDRFFIGMLPAILLLIAGGIHAAGRKLESLLLWVVVVLMMIGTWGFVYSPNQQREEWREAADILSQAEPQEKIILRVYQMFVPMNYYYNGTVEMQSMELNQVLTPLEELTEGVDRFWLVYWNAAANTHKVTGNPPFDPGNEEDPRVSCCIRGEGSDIINRYDLEGITIFHIELEN